MKLGLPLTTPKPPRFAANAPSNRVVSPNVAAASGDGAPAAASPAATSPAAAAAMRPVGALRFGALKDYERPLSDEEQIAWAEKLSSNFIDQRMGGLLSLVNQERITHPTVLRAVSRFLKYEDRNDSLNVMQRALAIRILEKNPSAWGLDSLLYTTQEVTAMALPQYSAMVMAKTLAQIDDTQPDVAKIKRRVLAAALDNLWSDNYASTRYYLTTALAPFMTLKDVPYLLYMANRKQSWNSTSPVSDFHFNIGRLLCSIALRSGKPDFIETLLKQYQETPTPPGNRNFSGTQATQQYLTRYILRSLPAQILQTPPADAETAKALLPAVMHAASVLTQNAALMRVNESSQWDEKENYVRAIDLLLTMVPEEERAPFIERARELVRFSSNNPILVAFVLADLMKNEASPLEIFHYSTGKKLLAGASNGNGSAEARSYLNKVSAENWSSLLYETRNDLRRRAGVPTPFIPPELRMQHAKLKTLGPTTNLAEQYIPNLRIMPADYVTLPFKPLYPVPETLSADWQPPKTNPPLLPPSAREQLRSNIDLFDKGLQAALAENNKNDAIHFTQKLLGSWVASKSPEAFDALARHIATSSIVADTFLSYFNRASGRGSSYSVINERYQNVHPRQLVWLAKQAMRVLPHTEPLRGSATDTIASRYQGLMIHVAAMMATEPNTVRHEGLSHALFETALSTFKHVNQAAPAGEVTNAQHYAAATLFHMLKLGVPDSVLDAEKETIAAMVKLINIDGGAINGRSDLALPWNRLYQNQNSWLGSSSNNNNGMDTNQRQNLALLCNLAKRTNTLQPMEQVALILTNYFANIRSRSYVDEQFLVAFARNPMIFEAAFQSKDLSLFNSYMQIINWYRIYELLPTLIDAIQRDLKTEDAVRAYAILAAISEGIDYYALPELEKLRDSATDATTRRLVESLIRDVQEPKLVSEMTRPFPLPEVAQPMYTLLGFDQAQPIGNDATDLARPIGEPDFDPEETITLTGSPEETDGNPAQPGGTENDANPFRVEYDPEESIRILGYDDPFDQTLNPLERFIKRGKRLNGGNDPLNRTRLDHLKDLELIAGQLSETSINVKLIDEDKTELIKKLATMLLREPDLSKPERLAILNILSLLPDRETLVPLYQRLLLETDRELTLKLLEVVSKFGKTTASIPELLPDLRPSPRTTNANTILADMVKDNAMDDGIRNQALAALVQNEAINHLRGLLPSRSIGIDYKSQIAASLGELWSLEPTSRAMVERSLLDEVPDSPPGSQFRDNLLFSLSMTADPATAADTAEKVAQALEGVNTEGSETTDPETNETVLQTALMAFNAWMDAGYEAPIRENTRRLLTRLTNSPSAELREQAQALLARFEPPPEPEQQPEQE